MDPNAALQIIRDNVQTYRDSTDAETANDAAERVVEAAADLDEWIVRGGFLPSDWAEPQRSTCRHCERAIVLQGGHWIDPQATGDDSIWRESCDAHDTFTAEHEPEGGAA